MSQADPLDQSPVFQLKGSMLAITVLELAQNDLERLDRQLAVKVEQAPDFFNNTPLVLALDKLPADSDLDLLVEPTAQTTLMDIGAIRFELKQLLGMEVDVLTPNSLPASFRGQVLREAVTV